MFKISCNFNKRKKKILTLILALAMIIQPLMPTVVEAFNFNRFLTQEEIAEFLANIEGEYEVDTEVLEEPNAAELDDGQDVMFGLFVSERDAINNENMIGSWLVNDINFEDIVQLAEGYYIRLIESFDADEDLSEGFFIGLYETHEGAENHDDVIRVWHAGVNLTRVYGEGYYVRLIPLGSEQGEVDLDPDADEMGEESEVTLVEEDTSDDGEIVYFPNWTDELEEMLESFLNDDRRHPDLAGNEAIVYDWLSDQLEDLLQSEDGTLFYDGVEVIPPRLPSNPDDIEDLHLAWQEIEIHEDFHADVTLLNDLGELVIDENTELSDLIPLSNNPWGSGSVAATVQVTQGWGNDQTLTVAGNTLYRVLFNISAHGISNSQGICVEPSLLEIDGAAGRLRRMDRGGNTNNGRARLAMYYGWRGSPGFLGNSNSNMTNWDLATGIVVNRFSRHADTLPLANNIFNHVITNDNRSAFTQLSTLHDRVMSYSASEVTDTNRWTARVNVAASSNGTSNMSNVDRLNFRLRTGGSLVHSDDANNLSTGSLYVTGGSTSNGIIVTFPDGVGARITRRNGSVTRVGRTNTNDQTINTGESFTMDMALTASTQNRNFSWRSIQDSFDFFVFDANNTAVQSAAFMLVGNPVTGSFSTTTTPVGELRVNKASNNQALVNVNPNYSIAGAQFGLFTTQAAAHAAATAGNAFNNGSWTGSIARWTTNTAGHGIVTQASGVANGTTIGNRSVVVPPGTYWVAEIVSPPGHSRSLTVHQVTVQAGDTGNDRVVTVTNGALFDPPEMRITKLDSGTGNTPQGDGLLQGAEFTLRFFHNNNWSGTPASTLVYRTDANGRIDFTDPSSLVPGQTVPPLFLDPMGLIRFPLGSLTLEETRAPEGFIRDANVYRGRIVRINTTPGVSFQWETIPNSERIRYSPTEGFTVYNDVIRGGDND